MQKQTDHIGNTNKMVTAVEWLIEKISTQGTLYSSDISQAKKIEREYLIEFYIKGCEDTYGMDEGHNDRNDAEYYYNKTFKSKQDER